MVKPPKWQNPKFAADPILFMVREGLAELKHLEQALRLYEEQSKTGDTSARAAFANLALRFNLGGWVASLNETCLALAYLSRVPGETLEGSNMQANYLKAQLEQADFVWGGAFRRALAATANVMAAKAKRNAAQRDAMIAVAKPVVRKIKELKDLADAWID